MSRFYGTYASEDDIERGRFRLQLNHYATRSQEYYMKVKICRGKQHFLSEPHRTARRSERLLTEGPPVQREARYQARTVRHRLWL